MEKVVSSDRFRPNCRSINSVNTHPRYNASDAINVTLVSSVVDTVREVQQSAEKVGTFAIKSREIRHLGMEKSADGFARTAPMWKISVRKFRFDSLADIEPIVFTDREAEGSRYGESRRPVLSRHNWLNMTQLSASDSLAIKGTRKVIRGSH